MPNAAEIKITELEQKLEEHKDKMTDEEYEERAQKLRDEREQAEEDSDKVDEAALADLETELANLDEAEDPPPAPPAAPPDDKEPALPAGAKPPNIFMRGMEKGKKMLEDAGTGTLKMIKSILIMMGAKDWATGLENYIDKGEVRDLLGDTFGENAKVVKSKNDDRDIRKLKRQYTRALNKKMDGLSDEKKAEMKEDYTFVTFCQERANKVTLPAGVGGNKPEISIGFLIDDKEEEEVEEKNPDGTPKDSKPAGDAENKEWKESAELKNAKYIFALTEALNTVAPGCIQATFTMENAISGEINDLKKGQKTERFSQTLTRKIEDFLTQDGDWNQTTGLSTASYLMGTYDEAPSVKILGIELDEGTLEERDGHSWLYDQNAIDYFDSNLHNNPQVAVNQLLEHKFTTGLASKMMPKVQAALKGSLQKYKLLTPEAPPAVPPAK